MKEMPSELIALIEKEAETLYPYAVNGGMIEDATTSGERYKYVKEKERQFSEAVELLEWILENQFKLDSISQEWKWVARNVNNKVLGFHGEATSAELYTKYIINKKLNP